MVKRGVKTRAKRTFRIVLLIIISLICVALVVFAALKIFPMLANHQETVIAKNIIAPMGKKTTLYTIERRLHDKNIVFDTIKEASDSATIVVEISDGPQVLLSKNQDVNWQVDSIILIMQHLIVNNKKPSLIDLTSSRPIVKF